MTLELFLRGLAIGFAIAFALGPIGLLVIRRTVDRGWAYGFLSGVGVATADAMYGAIAAFGLTAITNLLVGIDRPLGIVGGAVLVVLAVRSLRARLRSTAPAPRSRARTAAGSTAPSPPGRRWSRSRRRTRRRSCRSRPCSRASAPGRAAAAARVAVVVGVFTGSVAWWALLTGLIAGLRARMTPRVVRWLNIASAALIGGFGVVAIAIGVAG